MFDVSERLYLASGDTAEVRIVRDLSRPARRLESVASVRTLTEWISPEGGWTRRNGIVTVMSPEALAAELQGLRQESYAIYHRIARDDPKLRVELRSGGALFAFEQDERLLCWFQIAANGVLLGWGNVYDGAVNQHYYGPTGDMGDAVLPRFGVTSTGSYRFEYLGARLADGTLEAPDPGKEPTAAPPPPSASPQ